MLAPDSQHAPASGQERGAAGEFGKEAKRRAASRQSKAGARAAGASHAAVFRS